MHVPIGFSGVHAVPKTLHSHGLITPFKTSPHWQAFGSATRTPEKPIGTCMVSSEGACAAYYNYGRFSRRLETVT